MAAVDACAEHRDTVLGVMATIPPSIPQNATRVLVVDDEPGLRQVLTIAFRRQGYEVVVAPGARAAIEAIRQNPQPFPLILTDLVMPDGSGIEVLTAAKARSGATEVIVMTAHSTVESALDAMRHGAYDFVTKPFSPAELTALAAKALEKSSIVAENQRLRAQLERLDLPSREPLGTSAAMQRISELIGKIAPTRTTVLLTGESGTGKERVARAIHDQSDRAARPFLVVNCGARSL
jgi:two-component system, NtrC family, response regulator PilR